jgi:sulfatase modifying factor 1
MQTLEEQRQKALPGANKRLMVHVPSGPFTMGGRDEESPRAERPAHTVFLNDYYIARFPTTNQEYREFVQCTGHRIPIHWQRGTFPTGTGKHPVVNVSWTDAAAFAKWRGARLPTEAEWEKAARGDDERPYPWGPRFTEGERCNGNNQVGMTTPVDEFPEGRSECGVWDLCGNAYEWCHDFYDEEYYKNSPTTNPKGPEGGQERVVRGGCYMESRAGLRATHREGVVEVTTRDTIGFRIAMNAEATVEN